MPLRCDFCSVFCGVFDGLSLGIFGQSEKKILPIKHISVGDSTASLVAQP